MIIWTDAHISPAIAPWITSQLGVPAVAIRDLGLRDAKDQLIFSGAREANAVVLTKDADFAFFWSVSVLRLPSSGFGVETPRTRT